MAEPAAVSGSGMLGQDDAVVGCAQRERSWMHIVGMHCEDALEVDLWWQRLQCHMHASKFLTALGGASNRTLPGSFILHDVVHAGWRTRAVARLNTLCKNSQVRKTQRCRGCCSSS